ITTTTARRTTPTTAMTAASRSQRPPGRREAVDPAAGSGCARSGPHAEGTVPVPIPASGRRLHGGPPDGFVIGSCWVCGETPPLRSGGSGGASLEGGAGVEDGASVGGGGDGEAAASSGS